MNMACSLVFFDTFSHESSTSQLDLVQFQHPVQVSQIRVIPLGARVQADFPGGIRLGATNPSQFDIEFFVNDLSKRGAATFESIGSLHYSQAGEIKLDLGKRLPTDGLLLRGKYSTITLAVYGSLAKVYHDSPPKSQNDPPQPPPEKVNTHERIRDWLEDTKVPRSPDRPWDESVQDKSDRERRKDRQKGASREIDKLRHSHERSSHSREKSWDLSERGSAYRKGRQSGSLGKDTNRDLSGDREVLAIGKDVEMSDVERTRDSTEKEWEHESDQGRGKDSDYDKEHPSNRELYEEEINFPKKKRIIDEWEHRSETSNHSMRRPRTPQELEKLPADPRIRSPYQCADETQRKEWEDKDWDRESRDRDREWDRGKESYGNWSRSTSRDKDRGRSTPKSPEQLSILPHIMSDEMEAISDDEELLNLPVEANDVDYPNEENMEGSMNDENGAFEYEDIMSDEEELAGYQCEDEYVVEEWEDYIKPLSTLELLEGNLLLQHFHIPSLTEYEAQQWTWSELEESEKLISEKNALAAKLVSLIKDNPIPARLGEVSNDPDAICDLSVIENEEAWVHAVEYASQLLPGALACVDDKPETLQFLYKWVENGINFDMAMNQQQPLYKMRHIKAGVKLAVGLLQCTGSIAVDLLEQGIFDKLIELFNKEYMAVSIKLLILRAIDSIAIHLEGIRFLTSRASGRSGYEKILQLFGSAQQSRVKVSISSIVRKVHFLEVCDKLHDDVIGLSSVLQLKCEQMDEQEISDVKDIEIFENQFKTLLTSIESCLKEIIRCFVFADHLMTQSTRWLPGSKPFQLPKSNYDPFPQIFKILNETKVMEVIAVLLSSSHFIHHAAILNLVKTFLEHLLDVPHGLLYLSSKGDTASAIMKSLLQFEKDERDFGTESMFQQLGWKVAYSINIIRHLDSLSYINGYQDVAKFQKEFKLNDSTFDKACSHLNALQAILLSPIGKEVLVHILTIPRFSRILFPYLAVNPECDMEDQLHVLACYGYVVDLLVTSVKLSPTGLFLESCSAPLAEIISRAEINVKVDEYNKLRILLPYLSVAKGEYFSYDNLPALVGIIQESIDKLEKFPGELFSSLQILSHLTIPKRCLAHIEAQHCSDEMVEELRFKHASVQLFSADLHTHLINLLTKLCSMYAQSALLHGSNFATEEGKMVLLLIRPSVNLLKNLLAAVIEARNTDYKDLTAITPLLHTYLLLDLYPFSSPYYSEAQSTQGVIVSIILLYTQPVYITEGEEVLAKSLWTLMMAEIFKMLMLSPRNIVGILKLIIKLLPLPLPIYSHSPLTDDEALQIVRLRKLWSAHLYSLSGTLHDIVVRLGVGAHPNLTHNLRKMCVAVADLSAPMALLMARSALDLVAQSHRLDQKNATKDGEHLMSVQTCRVLGTLGSLVSHAPIKAAVIHLLRGGVPSLSVTKIKTEEKYPSLVNVWCKLLTISSHVDAHVASQNALLVILHSLFNQETTMKEFNTEVTTGDLSGVPPKDLLVPLVDAVVDTLRIVLSDQIAYMSISVLMLLMNHNYGFYYVKCAIDKKKAFLQPILGMLYSQMATNFDHSFLLFRDVISFCDALLHPTEHRTYVATPSDLISYLGWKVGLQDALLGSISPRESESCTNGGTLELSIDEKDGERGFDMNRFEQALLKMEDSQLKKIHPLLQLEKLVVENSLEDEISEYLNEDIKYIIGRMESESLSSESPHLECVDHSIESLQTQFACRVAWIFPNGDEDQSTWFLPPITDNLDQTDMVKVNLLEICRKYTEDYDLASALHKIAKGPSFQNLSPQKSAKNISKYKPSLSAIRPDRRGKPYVAPMRGRNFGRGSIRSDPFRSRPPNTSRPPSLHVDDFVALESTGHQPTGPTGYNKISFGRGKMMLDSMRGRGRQRSMNDSRGNRFFHRTPFRSLRPRPQGWGYRGDGSRTNYRVSSGGSGHFMRGRISASSYRGRGMSGNSKDRFSMKYVDRGRRKYA